MKTTTWKLTPQSQASSSRPGSVAVDEMLFFAGETEAPSKVGLFPALYSAILYLRRGFPFTICKETGQELMRFDGSRQVTESEFAKTLASFEYCMLEEHKNGYQAALDWVEETMDNSRAPAKAEAVETPENVESNKSVENSINRTGTANRGRR